LASRDTPSPAAFGAVIASGRDYRETLQVFQPGFRLDEERQ
jgi:hypothetical protein